MSERSDAKLIASLAAAHAAIGALLVELTEESPPAPVAPVPAPASGGGVICKHENREDQRTFGVTEAWRCKDCGYEYRR
jgi:hypothetical protein